MKKFALTTLTLLNFISLPSFADKKVTLALNWKPEPQFGGFYEAELKGFFKKNKVAVVIQPGGSGTPTVQMAAAGTVEFGIVSADELLISRERGSDLVALYVVYQTNPQGIMAHAERKFKNLGDVFSNPGTLAVQAGLPYADFLKKKYPNPKVKIVPYAGGISSFLSDPQYSQQCFVTSEPLAAKRAGKVPQTFLIAESGYNPYTTVIVTREKYWKQNQAQVQAFIQAVHLGWESYLKSPVATNQHMQSQNPAMDLLTFEESAKAQMDLIVPKTAGVRLGQMTEGRWSELGAQLKDLGVLKKAPDVKKLLIPYSQLIF